MNRFAPRLCCPLLLLGFWFSPAQLWGQDAPLNSWADREAKASIIGFVESVTDPTSEQFVLQADRIAVFDNDGTLWPENPLPFQLCFALDELKRLAPQNPEWKKNELLAAVMSGEMDVIKADLKSGLIAILSATHAGMTTADFQNRVTAWMKQAKHVRYQRRYSDLAYQPMLEVLSYLQANGFTTYIVSGGGIDFMRAWSEDVYGIPPQQVIGSQAAAVYQVNDGAAEIVKQWQLDFVDEKEGKPMGIYRHLGRRPILAFGNSDGDRQMLEWTTLGRSPGLGVIVHHTDAEREYAYDRQPKSSGKLEVALQKAPGEGWVVVDMANDWKTVFVDSEVNSEMSFDAIAGPTWIVETINGKDVVDQSPATMIIGEGGKVAGNSGVNRYSGTAEINGSNISFGPLATTRRAGPPALMAQESSFLKAMSTVVSIEISVGRILSLVDKSGEPVLRFFAKTSGSATE